MIAECKSFWGFFFLVICILSARANTLIVIRGTANCGKSSLCRQLSILDNSYKIISQDDINRKMTYEILENVFPHEMVLIRRVIKYENMWQAIKCFNLVFIPEIHEQEKQKASEAISRIRNFFDDPAHYNQWMAINTRAKYKVMEELLLHTASGCNIILDAWGITNWDHELEELADCFDHIVRVVAYCSLETIVQRWQKRNQQAVQTDNYQERRFFSQMLGSFFGFLEPATTDQEGFLSVTKKDFDALIEKAAQCSENFRQVKYSAVSSFSSHEFTPDELSVFKEKMYAKFGFEHTESVLLKASTSHDILLCTEGECADYAHELLGSVEFLINIL
jgi:deoxyadenosine/deoxycytidine kinase